MVKTDPARRMEIEPVDEPKAIGTFVKERAVAERMLAGAKRHLNSLPPEIAALRAQGVHLTANQLRGTVRRARRQQASESGQTHSAQRKRAREFNAKHGGKHGTQDKQEEGSAANG